MRGAPHPGPGSSALEATRTRSLPRRAAGAALLVAASTLVALALGELAVRRAREGTRLYLDAAPLRLAAANVASVVRHDPDPDVLAVLGKSVDESFMGARVRTNAEGFRGPELLEGTRRIVGIGDSVMFGWGVEEPDTYLRRLEALLRPAAPDVEVVNTAVPGYNTEQEIAVLRRHLDRLRPRWVIVGFVGNDFDPPQRVFERATWLEKRSWLYRLVRARSRGWTPEDRVRRRKERGLAALAELGELARDRGFRVLAFLYAGLVNDKSILKPHPEVRDVCLREGFLIVDLQDMLLEAIARGEIATSYDIWISKAKPIDPHPSSLGHRIIADGLGKALAPELARAR